MAMDLFLGGDNQKCSKMNNEVSHYIIYIFLDVNPYLQP
jgi:hypothetical protein